MYFALLTFLVGRSPAPVAASQASFDRLLPPVGLSTWVVEASPCPLEVSFWSWPLLTPSWLTVLEDMMFLDRLSGNAALLKITG
jgi:hypothetical protein